jgi:alpha-ketoglutarate-dependent 2,4-dichlorophenoxyacetate dioxygenase
MAIQVSQLHPTLGAEVREVDLTLTVTPEVFAEIEAAFNRYGILVFPEQPVNDEQQLAFSQLFGPLEVNPNYAGAKDAPPPRYRGHLKLRCRRAGAGA